MTDFEKFLSISGAKIDSVLNTLFDEWIGSTERMVPRLSRLTAPYRESAFGGKMIRGSLVELGYLLTNAQETSEVLKVAAAFELVHSGLLIQDDVIDKSGTRRGKPSLYKRLGKGHYGVSQAICLGDLDMFWAINIIAESNFESHVKAQALSAFSDVITQTILGQMLDIELGYHPKKSLTEKEVISVCRLKTAAYSFIGPLMVGAILGGGSKSLISDLKLFAENVGIAFQIQDDILGIYGQKEIVGKSVSSDIKEGKSTLLIYYALRHATPNEYRIIEKYYGDRNVTDEGCNEIKNVFKNTNALHFAETRARLYARRAKSFIPSITRDKASQSLLRGLADKVIGRQK